MTPGGRRRRRPSGEALLLAGACVALVVAAGLLVQPLLGDRGGVDLPFHLGPAPLEFEGVTWGTTAQGPGEAVARAETLLRRTTATLLVLVALAAGLGQVAASSVRTAARRPEARVRRAVGATRKRLLRDRGREAAWAVGAGFLLGGLAALPASVLALGQVPFLSASSTGVLLPALALAGGVLVAWALFAFGVVQSGESLPGGPLHAGASLAEPFQGERGHAGVAVLQVAGVTTVLVAVGMIGLAEAEPRDDPGARFLVTAAPGEGAAMVEHLQRAVEHRTVEQSTVEQRPPGGADPGIAVTSPGFWEGLGITRLVQTECGECVIPGSPPVRTRVKGESAVHHAVSPDTFRMAGITLLDGRAFEAADTALSEPVAIVSRAFALEHFQDGDAIGRRVRLGIDRDRWHTVVGVVEALPRRRLAARQQPPHDILVPVAQTPPSQVEVVTASMFPMLAEPESTGIHARPDVQVLAQVHARDRLLAEWTGGYVRVWRLAGLLAAALALLGLGLTVGRRVREDAAEMAIHRAVGASRRRILARYAGFGVKMGALGTLLGCWASLFMTGAVVPEAFALPGVAGGPMVRVALGLTLASGLVALVTANRTMEGSIREGLG